MESIFSARSVEVISHILSCSEGIQGTLLAVKVYTSVRRDKQELIALKTMLLASSCNMRNVGNLTPLKQARIAN